jgi:hypothetical protein
MEPYLEQRIEAAKQKAKSIVDGKIEDEEDLRLVFQFVLCQKYNMPIFDSYFADRTLDELMFEVYLHKEASVKLDPELAKEDAADFVREEANKDEYWEDLEMQSDDDFLEQAKKDFGIKKQETENDEST